MPSNLSKNLTPLGVSSATITKIYGSIKTAKTQSDDIRAAVITGVYSLPLTSSFYLAILTCDLYGSIRRNRQAALYRRSCSRYVILGCSSLSPHFRSRILTFKMFFLLVAAFVPLIAALLTTNYYLGKTQNAVDGKLHAMYREGGSEEHAEGEFVQEKK